MPAESLGDGLVRHLVSAAMYSAVGIVVFAVAFAIMRKVMPFSIHKEIAEDQNTALAIVMGSVILGMAIIVAAAVAG